MTLNIVSIEWTVNALNENIFKCILMWNCVNNLINKLTVSVYNTSAHLNCFQLHITERYESMICIRYRAYQMI